MSKILMSLLVLSILVTVARAGDIDLQKAPPVVVKAIPESGSNAVDPNVTEIKVTEAKT